jgi:hypothetical protein
VYKLLNHGSDFRYVECNFIRCSRKLHERNVILLTGTNVKIVTEASSDFQHSPEIQLDVVLDVRNNV